jgi:CBS domain-containing protein
VKKIRELLDDKGTQVWSVAPTSSVLDALRLMVEKSIGAVLVMDQGRLTGIFAERDLTTKVVLEGRSAGDSLVSEVMTARPVCVSPGQTVDDAMALMTDKRVRHLPVVEGERVVGLISIGDAVKATISHQQFVIGQLETYISS